MMRFLIVACVGVLLAGSASAGQKEDAFAVIEQFKKAYDASDPPAVVKLFATDSVFMGTTMQGPTNDKNEILKYFQASASANLPKKVEIEKYEVLQLSDTAILFAGQNVFTQTREGKPAETPARFSLLIVREGPEWRIGHFHSSRRP